VAVGLGAGVHTVIDESPGGLTTYDINVPRSIPGLKARIAAEGAHRVRQGRSRRIRRADKLPAVLYGFRLRPFTSRCPPQAGTGSEARRQRAAETVAGGDHSVAHRKQVQRDPLRGFIEHATC